MCSVVYSGLSLTGLSSRWSQSLRWLTRVKASGTLSPSEQKSSSTASGRSSVQLSTTLSTCVQRWLFCSAVNHDTRFPLLLQIRSAFEGSIKLQALWFGYLSLPVCVESFGDASSRDAKAWLCVGVCQSWEGWHSLHFPPAQLLQSICTHLQQRRREQVPHRRAKMNTLHLLGILKQQRQRNKVKMWGTAYAPLQLLVIPPVGVTAGQHHSPGEPAGFDPRHNQLTKLFVFCLQLKQRLDL